MNEDKLIKKAKEGDDVAFKELSDMYEGKHRMIMRKFFYIDSAVKSEDVYQDVLLVFYEAIKTFDPSKKIKFSTYAEKLVKSKIYNIIRHSKALKRKYITNTFINKLLDDENADFSEADILGDYRSNPDDLLEIRETIDEIKKVINKDLDDFEKEVLRLYIREVSYHDIAKRVDVNLKKVDNTIYKIKRKLKRFDSI